MKDNIKHLLWVSLIVLIIILFCGCPERAGYYVHNDGGVVKTEMETGLASYYGVEFHGKPTASGETYDMWGFTCAHPTLPFDTYLLVTNLENGNSVVVRVNDRGPFVEGRIIDLSYNAARSLDMIGEGVVEVKVEVVR